MPRVHYLMDKRRVREFHTYEYHPPSQNKGEAKKKEKEKRRKIHRPYKSNPKRREERERERERERENNRQQQQQQQRERGERERQREADRRAKLLNYLLLPYFFFLVSFPKPKTTSVRPFPTLLTPPSNIIIKIKKI